MKYDPSFCFPFTTAKDSTFKKLENKKKVFMPLNNHILLTLKE